MVAWSILKVSWQISGPVIASELSEERVSSTSAVLVYSPTDVDGARFDHYQILVSDGPADHIFNKSRFDTE